MLYARMRNPMLRLTILTAFLSVPTSTPSIGFATVITKPACAQIQQEKSRIYGFHPSRISKEEQKSRSNQMDQFWSSVKSQGQSGRECLKQLILAEQQDGFFVFDGTSLLMDMDQSPASLEVALAGLSKTNLKDIDSSGYIRMALFLFHKGLEITPLAEHYMIAQEVKGFVPQHAMRLDRETGAFFLYGSMPITTADQSLVRMLSVPELPARSTAALMLSMSMTEESYTALKSLPKTFLPEQIRIAIEKSTKYQSIQESGPFKMTRAEVLNVLSRIPNYGGDFWGVAGDKEFTKSAVGTLAYGDLPALREARRRSLSGLSDEALHEYFALSHILLRVINRLDLYGELRDH
ncbi:MAG: hypothetical protein IT389_11860 [Nitrospira sp.]|nr:hypothetical protein [Nitrospira sp.]